MLPGDDRLGGHGSAADRADVLCAGRVGGGTGRGLRRLHPHGPRAAHPLPRSRASARTSCCSISDDQAWSDFTPALMPSVYAQLVDQGVLFKRAYVNTSLCCPSRAQIVTGLYEHHTGVDTNTVPLERPTIVEALHDVGYRTMLAGKYLNSWPCTPRPEFDRWACVGTPTPVDVLHDQPRDQRGRRVGQLPGLPDRHPGGSAGERSSSPRRRTSRSSRCTRRPRRTCRRTIRGTTPCPSRRRATRRSTTTRSATARRCTHAGRRSPSTRSRAPTSGTPGWRTASGRSTTRSRRSWAASATEPATRSSSTCPTTDSCSASTGGSARPTRTKGPSGCPMVIRVSRDALSSTRSRLTPWSRTWTSRPTLASVAGFPWQADGRSLVPLLDGSAKSVRSALLIEHCRGVNVGSVPCSGLSFYAHQTRAGGYWGVVTARDKYVTLRHRRPRAVRPRRRIRPSSTT